MKMNMNTVLRKIAPAAVALVILAVVVAMNDPAKIAAVGVGRGRRGVSDHVAARAQRLVRRARLAGAAARAA